jgi:2-dehydropantoate 2-reductase
VRDERRKLLDERGLRIESLFGDARLIVTTAAVTDLTPIYDAIILTCKACDLDAAVARSRRPSPRPAMFCRC